MKKTYLLAAALSLSLSNAVLAQCPAGRYLTDQFSVTKTTVTYSTPYNLEMDIFEPTGDTYAARPLIILGHGGSFISGNKSDDGTIVNLCNKFAKRGYVTASIDYRLGDLFSMSSDSSNAIETVIKAISDGKAAIRYFMKDAATTNTYRIDTNNIFVGGNSAGAVLYMHVGYLGSISECPSYIATAMAANGGFEGNSGNDGYTTRCRGIINLAGALNLTSFVDVHDKPSVNAQGTTDAIVPYNCGYPLSGAVHVNLCGLGTLQPVFDAQGVYHKDIIFPGDGHVPWSSNTTKFNSVDSIVKEFLYDIICNGALAVSNTIADADLNIFPNPASASVSVQAAVPIATVNLIDPTGRVLVSMQHLESKSATISTAAIPTGLYFLRLTYEGGPAPETRQLTIQH